MDKIIKKIITEDLSGVNITQITRGNCIVRLYEELLNFHNIVDAIGTTGNMVLLLPTQKDVETTGHWVAVLFDKDTNTINHWDSYGLNWKQERAYSNNEYIKEHLLGNLYRKAINEGYKVTYNQHRLQKMSNGINTCGRWVSTRVRFSYLSNDEFAEIFLNQKYNPDYLVSLLTFFSITDDITYEQEIITTMK